VVHTAGDTAVQPEQAPQHSRGDQILAD
jgi:hypothetical protein